MTELSWFEREMRHCLTNMFDVITLGLPQQPKESGWRRERK